MFTRTNTNPVQTANTAVRLTLPARVRMDAVGGTNASSALAERCVV